MPRCLITRATVYPAKLRVRRTQGPYGAMGQKTDRERIVSYASSPCQVVNHSVFTASARNYWRIPAFLWPSIRTCPYGHPHASGNIRNTLALASNFPPAQHHTTTLPANLIEYPLTSTDHHCALYYIKPLRNIARSDHLPPIGSCTKVRASSAPVINQTDSQLLGTHISACIL